MKFSRAFWFLAAVLIIAPLARADSTTTMEFTGVNGANDGVYYVSPYTGIMNYGTSNAQTVVLFCDDINNEVSFNQVWNANETSLASSNFSNTRYGNGSVNPNLGGMNPQVLYEEAAWLVTQFSSHSGDYVSLQYALWDLMTPGAESTSFANADGTTVAQWLALAAANYGQIDSSNFMIVTNTGTLAYTGQVQEFIVQTPEPATGVLLLFGLVAMVFLYRRSPQLSA
ncbi:MAG: PEP-CTERM sorting domain-containing protein [Candidatus Acidiferrum sp.]